MGNSDDIKIRTLPRGDEVKKTNAKPAPVPSPVVNPAEAPAPSYTLYLGGLSVLIILGVIFGPKNGQKIIPAKTESTTLASVQPTAKPKLPPNVDKYYNETEIKREMMVHQSEIQNYNFKATAQDTEGGMDYLSAPDDKNLGVSMDTEDPSASVFADLNENNNGVEEMSPADRINARLANRKWINENDRRERVAALAAIIKNAYDQGYELQINQNLVVTGVKRINNNRPININQALDRLAKGQ